MKPWLVSQPRTNWEVGERSDLRRRRWRRAVCLALSVWHAGAWGRRWSFRQRAKWGLWLPRSRTAVASIALTTSAPYPLSSLYLMDCHSHLPATARELSSLPANPGRTSQRPRCWQREGPQSPLNRALAPRTPSYSTRRGRSSRSTFSKKRLRMAHVRSWSMARQCAKRCDERTFIWLCAATGRKSVPSSSRPVFALT